MFALSAILIGVIGVFYVRRRSAAKSNRPSSATRAKQFVCRGQDDSAQPVRVIWRQFGEEGSHHARGARGAVARERRVHPAFREKDVARPLNLLEHREARRNVVQRRLRAQRMVEVGRPLRAPTARGGDSSTSPRLAKNASRIAWHRPTAPAARMRTAPCDPDSRFG